eukprot:398419-Hanusia_phi.AAC.1
MSMEGPPFSEERARKCDSRESQRPLSRGGPRIIGSRPGGPGWHRDGPIRGPAGVTAPPAAAAVTA